MTPKQKYDERKRLRLENDLRLEQRRKDRLDREEDIDTIMRSFVRSFERLADVAELWADMQKDAAK